jgi:phosphoribosylaminoimidazolecarboxamide formyltransferase/IMP cyclohydrolase
MNEHEIGAIDLVVVNLYPFVQTVAKGGTREEIIENIDIGGPSMVRSAAKNHDFVAIVTDPADYAIVAGGETTLAQRRKFAAKAYALTAAYDGAISQWFATVDQGETFPETSPSPASAWPSCAMAKTRIRRRRFTCPMAPGPRVWPRPCRCRARS